MHSNAGAARRTLHGRDDANRSARRNRRIAAHARAAENGADHPKLEDLIPIAVVIAAGCDLAPSGWCDAPWRQGACRGTSSGPSRSWRTCASGCFRTKIAPEVVERMSGPLARARKTLEELAGTGVAAGPRHSCT
jgi:hypothetical protein